MYCITNVWISIVRIDFHFYLAIHLVLFKTSYNVHTHFQDLL